MIPRPCGKLIKFLHWRQVAANETGRVCANNEAPVLRQIEPVSEASFRPSAVGLHQFPRQQDKQFHLALMNCCAPTQWPIDYPCHKFPLCLFLVFSLSLTAVTPDSQLIERAFGQTHPLVAVRTKQEPTDRELLGAISDACARGWITGTDALAAQRLLEQGQPLPKPVRAAMLGRGRK